MSSTDRNEDLLELALSRDPRRATEKAAARDAPDRGSEFRALEAWIASCRAACPALMDGVGAEDALVSRILGNTTREDLGWRGDVGLLGQFVRARWRSSVALRLAAASLLLHLLALPVLAFLVLREEPRAKTFQTGVELPAETLPIAAEEPERDLEYPEGFEAAELALVEVPDRLAVENARRLARLALESTPGPGVAYPSGGEEPRGVEAWLETRARLLAQLPVGRELGEPGRDPLERALWLEVQLDLWLMGAGPAPAVEGLGPVTTTSRGTPSERLLAAALGRAASLGLVGSESMGLAPDAAGAPGSLQEGPPLSPSWARDLRAALVGHDGPAAQRWSSWAEARSAQ